MQQRRAVIIRCRWESYPAEWPDPPQIPDETLQAMFSRTAGLWSVAELWHHATLGEIDFDEAVLLDVGALPGKGFDGSKDPDGNVITPSRPETIDAAISKAQSQDFTFASGDVPIVIIAPPPSDAGAHGSRCLFDVLGNQSFMAHEFGHALNFDHSWGPAFGDPDAEYCDPYCVMSCDMFGYRAPWANGLLTGVNPKGLPSGWTVQMGPLPAAADVWLYNADFAKCPAVVQIDLASNQRTVILRSYGAANSQSDMVLAVADSGAFKWFVEYRGAHGWDRGIGLGPKWNPGANGNYDPTPPGLVIHRLDAAGHVVYVDVVPTSQGAPQAWRASDDAFNVTLRAIAPDERWTEVELGPQRLRAQRIGSETSDYGAACVSAGNVFINEDHFVGWVGTANFHPNIAKSDDSQHQVAYDDTTSSNVGLSTEGTSIWMAWSGTNPGQPIKLFNGEPGKVFARKIVRVNDSSPAGPALAHFNGQLYLAYMGLDGGIYVVAGADDPGTKAHQVGTENTITGPALTAGSGRLYLSWAGTDGAGLLNVVSSSDGISWANKVTFVDETTSFSPALLGAEPGRLYIAWTGTNAAHYLNLGMIDLNKLQHENGDAHLDGKIVFPTGSIGAPGLAPTTSGYDLILAWAGIDGPGNLYTAFIDFPFPVASPPIK
jgi:hypothetical protein